jgi:hypothetical protein
MARLAGARAVVPTRLLVVSVLVAGMCLGRSLWHWRRVRHARQLRAPVGPDIRP